MSFRVWCRICDEWLTDTAPCACQRAADRRERRARETWTRARRDEYALAEICAHALEVAS